MRLLGLPQDLQQLRLTFPTQPSPRMTMDTMQQNVVKTFQGHLQDLRGLAIVAVPEPAKSD